jgi:hypothetical protein
MRHAISESVIVHSSAIEAALIAELTELIAARRDPLAQRQLAGLPHTGRRWPQGRCNTCHRKLAVVLGADDMVDEVDGGVGGRTRRRGRRRRFVTVTA